MTIKIETLTEQDLEQTIECCVACFGEEWRKNAEIDFLNSFADHPYKLTVFIAKDGDKVVGISCIPQLGITPNTYGISWLCVLPEYRGEKLGQKLITACEDFIKTLPMKWSKATVMLSCAIDKEYYEGLGYESVTTLHNTDTLMLKTIQP